MWGVLLLGEHTNTQNFMVYSKKEFVCDSPQLWSKKCIPKIEFQGLVSAEEYLSTPTLVAPSCGRSCIKIQIVVIIFRSLIFWGPRPKMVIPLSFVTTSLMCMIYRRSKNMLDYRSRGQRLGDSSIAFQNDIGRMIKY